MSVLAYIAGLAALLLMSTALYYINRENDQLRAENHRLKEENTGLHILLQFVMENQKK